MSTSLPLLLDLSHTSHTRARTGIQRVTRSLRAALGSEAVAITHDPHAQVWRQLEPWEHANLEAKGAALKRGAHWPLAAQLRGRARRAWRAGPPSLPDNAGLVVPEIFSPAVAAALPALFAATKGPRIALFHDAIALRLPELTPVKTVARFPAYLVELRQFDGIAAVSEDSRDALVDYWQWLGLKNIPPVRAIPLGYHTHESAPTGENFPAARAGNDGPTLLCVGSIEGRKNHAALLAACEDLWTQGRKFSLQLLGLAQPETGREALAQIRALQAAGRPLRYDGPVGDAALDQAYAGCAFTVYPSVAEGFGLPVIESLAHGKPCVCSGRGALGESARGGGCLALDSVDRAALASAIDTLLGSPEQLAELTSQARRRRFRTWSDYARELTGWVRSLAGA